MTTEASDLADAVERYLVARYPGDETLAELTERRIQHHDHALAFALRRWRIAAQWPDPEVLGEVRCVDCNKVMGDESSAAADESVCHDCAKEDL